MRFDRYAVGDYVVLERRFTREHYLAFERFSGDSNPLHKDAVYGAASEFGRTVVPMQMVASPLSAIAGMHFPGEPSLCLGQDVRAVAPVFFGDRLTYSARVRAINRTHRVLTLSVIALRGVEVVLEGELRVQSRLEEWPMEPHYLPAATPTVLVTGAAGAVGAAIARALSRQGWPLWLHAREASAVVQGLAAECTGLGSRVRLVTGDLERSVARAQLAKTVAAPDGPTVLVHTASPPVDAPLARLAAVNYTALRELGDAMLPNALKRQEGRIMVIGSMALDRSPAGWDDYIAAKSMATSYINSINQRFGSHGIGGVVLAPGFVRTAYAAKWIKDEDDAMLPEEVAAVAAEWLTAGTASYVRLEAGRSEAGRWGFAPQSLATVAAAQPVAAATQAAAAPAVAGHAGFDDTVRRLLRLPDTLPLQGAGLGRTPGWDSLRHIELILGIERSYGIGFTAGEIERTRDFESLADLWRQKVAA